MQVAAVVAMIATVYMRVFLEESLPYKEDQSLKQPILAKSNDHDEPAEDITVNIDDHDGQIPPKKKFPSLQDLLSLLTIR